MISEIDVDTAFKHLLGRAPSGEETRMFTAHFASPGSDEVAGLHNALLRSEEFRNRRLAVYRWAHFEPLELDRSRLAFVHIEKCGGTTLRAMLEPLFNPARICPERFDGLGNWTINEMAAYDLFAGHFDFAVCRSIPGDVRVLTMLREPRARLLSLHRFWRSHLPHPERDNHNLMALARAHDAETFFAHPRVASHPSIRDAIAGQIVRTGPKRSLDSDDRLVAAPSAVLDDAWAKLRDLAAFGLMERFEDSRVLLNEQLGLAMQTMVPRQVLADLTATGGEFMHVPLAPMTRRLDGLLNGLTTVDRPLYARARRLFEQRWAARKLTTKSTTLNSLEPERAMQPYTKFANRLTLAQIFRSK